MFLFSMHIPLNSAVSVDVFKAQAQKNWFSVLKIPLTKIHQLICIIKCNKQQLIKNMHWNTIHSLHFTANYR